MLKETNLLNLVKFDLKEGLVSIAGIIIISCIIAPAGLCGGILS